MTELEIDMNMRIGEWSILQESGRELTPCYGPGYTGLSNLGNRWGVRERGERKGGDRVVAGRGEKRGRKGGRREGRRRNSCWKYFSLLAVAISIQ